MEYIYGRLTLRVFVIQPIIGKKMTQLPLQGIEKTLFACCLVKNTLSTRQASRSSAAIFASVLMWMYGSVPSIKMLAKG